MATETICQSIFYGTNKVVACYLPASYKVVGRTCDPDINLSYLCEEHYLSLRIVCIEHHVPVPPRRDVEYVGMGDD